MIGEFYYFNIVLVLHKEKANKIKKQDNIQAHSIENMRIY